MTQPKVWKHSVLAALHRCAANSADGLVYRQSLLTTELPRIILETASTGTTPEQTLSRTLQEIRDDGDIEFAGHGAYRLVLAPIDAEEVDLIAPEMDSRIRRKLLTLGRVDTDNPVAIARRRHGQDRLRAMTLQNYAGACALCDIADTSLLIASHIVPWSVSAQARGDLSNIICLCRFHDALFDLGFWSLGEHYQVMQKPAQSAWAIKALLPISIAFRPPTAFEPCPLYVAQHRLRHAFNTAV